MSHVKQTSGDIAKDRLKLLLVSERAECSPEVMEMMKNDIIQVISKYMLIDQEGLDIKITNNKKGKEDSQVLYANIPIRGRRLRSAGS